MDGNKKLKKRRKELDEKKSFRGHGLSFNLPNARDFYAPARDFAHNYPVMIKSMIRAFNSDYWPNLFGLLVRIYGKTPEATFDDLEKAKDIYCTYLSICCENPSETVQQVLERAGWNTVATEIQMAWFAMMGQVMTGQLFAGIRDLTPAGGKGGKLENVMHFIDEGHAARRALNGLLETQEQQMFFRETVRGMRASGIEFDAIHELVKDVELGRV